MFCSIELQNNGEEPPSKWLKKPILVAVYIVIGVFFPNLAHESTQPYGYDNLAVGWDYGSLKAPVLLHTEITPKTPPPAVKRVTGYGNGSCVPYARARTGINIYGWAGTFLKQAPQAGYTVVAEPVKGAILVTSESGGHVAAVEEVTATDILISEQNYKGLYIVSWRRIPLESNIILGYIR